MKNLLLMLLIFVSFSTTAQFNKGRILVGGNVGFSSTTSKSKFGSSSAYTTSKSSEFSFTPQAGYFIIDNLAIGAGLNLELTTLKPEADVFDEVSTALLFQPFVRYYIKPGVFFQGAYGIGSQKDKQTYQDVTQEQKYGARNWLFAVGYAIFLNDRVAVEPMLGYKTSTLKNKDADSKSWDSSLFFKVGLQVYLRD